jgi:hypothetical protein
MKLAFSTLKWLCIALSTTYLGFKWVQHEFKALANEVVEPRIQTIEKLRENDMKHLDKRFDRIETLINRRRNGR